MGETDKRPATIPGSGPDVDVHRSSTYGNPAGAGADTPRLSREYRRFSTDRDGPTISRRQELVIDGWVARLDRGAVAWFRDDPG